MVVAESLEDLIRRYVVLGKRSATGFHAVVCQVCHDHSPRGGFKFEGDGKVGYWCFNCAAKAVYDPNIAKRSAPKNLLHVLSAFGVPEDEVKRVVASKFLSQQETVTVSSAKKQVGLPVSECELPPGSVLILSDDSPWCEVAREYLKSRRLDPSAYPYFVTDDERYAGRLIVPYMFRERVIYWQGRALDDAVKPKYLNVTTEKNNIFFNMDELYRYTDEPLYVTEGFTDALSIGQNAVSIVGSVLGEFRIKELTRVAKQRKVVFVLDKNYNGYVMGQNVLYEGSGIEWYVTALPEGIPDSNAGLIANGRLWLLNYLSANHWKGFKAQTYMAMYFDTKPPKKTKK